MRQYVFLLIYLTVGELIYTKASLNLTKIIREQYMFFTPSTLIFQLSVSLYFVVFGYLLYRVLKPEMDLGLKGSCVSFFLFLAVGSYNLLPWLAYYLKGWIAFGWNGIYTGSNGGFRAAALIAGGLIAGNLIKKYQQRRKADLAAPYGQDLEKAL